MFTSKGHKQWLSEFLLVVPSRIWTTVFKPLSFLEYLYYKVAFAHNFQGISGAFKAHSFFVFQTFHRMKNRVWMAVRFYWAMWYINSWIFLSLHISKTTSIMGWDALISIFSISLYPFTMQFFFPLNEKDKFCIFI